MKTTRSFVASLVFSILCLTWFASPVFAANIQQAMGTYVVAKGQTVQGNISLGMGTVNVLGRVDGNIKLGTGTVDVSGIVTGNVEVGMGTIDIIGSGRILGQTQIGVGSMSGKAGSINVGNFNMFPVRMTAPFSWLGEGFGWMVNGILRLLGNVVISGLLVTVFPAMMGSISRDIDRETLSAAGIGCLGSVGLFVAMAGLVVIIIGIPVALLLALAWIGAILVGNGALVWWLGQRVDRVLWPALARYPYREIFEGGLVLTIGEMIPGIGWLVALSLGMVAFGSVLRTRFGTHRPWWPLYRHNDTT